jgi:hypothetical protein
LSSSIWEIVVVVAGATVVATGDDEEACSSPPHPASVSTDTTPTITPRTRCIVRTVASRFAAVA